MIVYQNKQILYQKGVIIYVDNGFPNRERILRNNLFIKHSKNSPEFSEFWMTIRGRVYITGAAFKSLKKVAKDYKYSEKEKIEIFKILSRYAKG